MNEQTVRAYIEAVNAHQSARMSLLLTEDHLFTDAANNQHTGKVATLKAWASYLEWFPDFKIEVEQVLQQGDTLALFGFASGTFRTLNSDSTDAHWRLPAAWKAVVKGDKIAAWQAYSDTKVPMDILTKYAPAQDSGVVGFGGVFFKSEKPKELQAWYDAHLGTNFGSQGYAMFKWRDYESKREASTTFGIFKASTDYFKPSEKPFMFNFIVRDLESLLTKLRGEGVQVMEKVESYDYGKFGWIIDPEGNKIELWQPMGE